MKHGDTCIPLCQEKGKERKPKYKKKKDPPEKFSTHDRREMISDRKHRSQTIFEALLLKHIILLTLPNSDMQDAIRANVAS
jgi:5'-3' exonuclease